MRGSGKDRGDRSEKIVSGENLYRALGQTDSGRYLTVSDEILFI